MRGGREGCLWEKVRALSRACACMSACMSACVGAVMHLQACASKPVRTGVTYVCRSDSLPHDLHYSCPIALSLSRSFSINISHLSLSPTISASSCPSVCLSASVAASVAASASAAVSLLSVSVSRQPEFLPSTRLSTYT
eukprot:1852572-Pleurochrysis_carterae.AAC.2